MSRQEASGILKADGRLKYVSIGLDVDEGDIEAEVKMGDGEGRREDAGAWELQLRKWSIMFLFPIDFWIPPSIFLYSMVALQSWQQETPNTSSPFSL